MREEKKSSQSSKKLLKVNEKKKENEIHLSGENGKKMKLKKRWGGHRGFTRSRGWVYGRFCTRKREKM